ncbi:MAG: hypothetical protein ACI4DO_01140 [Roseburia sp.]
MKKKIVLALSLVLCLGLCACGSNDASGNASNSGSTTQESSNDGADNSDAEETYQVSYNGAELFVNENMADVLDVLGEPNSYFESESCAFQGMDKVYNYGSVVINTYPDGDKDFILTIELKDDMVETGEGIAIGSTKDEVQAAYGEADQENSTSLSYVKGSCTLAFIFDGDMVSAITYTSDKASE